VISQAKHIAGIDAIRLIAAILVMFFHYGFWSGAYPAGAASKISQGLISFPQLYAWTDFGWIGVQTFFVISGFVIAFSGERADTAYKFFVTRAVRLWPTALVCSTITLLAVLLMPNTSYGSLFMAYLRSIFFIPFGTYIDASYWTLGIEVAFYAMVFGLIAIRRFKWIKLLAVILGLQSTIFWATYAIAASSPNSVLFQHLRHLQDSRVMELILLHHGCFFALGIFLWIQLTKQSSRANILWSLLFAATGCLQIYGVTLSFYYKFGINQPLITPIALWLLSLVAITLAVVYNKRVHQAPEWLIASLRRMGLMTYPLYLLHQTAGLALMGELVKWVFNPYLALFSTITLAFAAAWLVCTCLEPPLQRFTREILLRLKAQPKPVLADIL